MALQLQEREITDFNAPADIEHFDPVNPYAMRPGKMYLYTFRCDEYTASEDTTYFEKYGEIPLGDYIVEFKRYRPANFSKRNFPISWKQSSRIIMRPEEVKLTKKYKEIFAQCRILYYREEPGIPWRLIDELDDAFGAINIDSQGTRIDSQYSVEKRASLPKPIDISVGKVEYYLEIFCGLMSCNLVLDLGEWGDLISKEPENHPDNIPRQIQEIKADIDNDGYGTDESGYESMDDLDEPPPPPPTLTRHISSNISDQEDEKTCWANVIARLLLKVFRETIPEFFDTLVTEHYCNSIYNVHLMRDISYHASICDRSCGYQGPGNPSTAHNLLLFAFIYKIVINYNGCGSGITWVIITWFVNTFINVPQSALTDKEFINDTFMQIPKGKPCIHPQFYIIDKDIQRIADMCRAFFTRFYEKNPGGLRLYRFTIPPSGITPEAIQIIRHVIDSGYYLTLSGKEIASNGRHVITMVNYSIESGKFYITAKNSWGRTIIYNETFKSDQQNGKIKFTMDSEVALYYNDVIFALPSSLSPDTERLPGLNFCIKQTDCGIQYGEAWICKKNQCVKPTRILPPTSYSRRRSRRYSSVPSRSSHAKTRTRRTKTK